VGEQLAAWGSAGGGNPHQARRSLKRTKPPLKHVAIQGSSLLIFYYAGVMDSMLKCGAVVPGVTKMAGLSGGAITSVLTTVGLNGTQQFKFWRDAVVNCATRQAAGMPASCASASNQCKADAFGCAGRLNAALKQALAEFLTPDHLEQSELAAGKGCGCCYVRRGDGCWGVQGGGLDRSQQTDLAHTMQHTKPQRYPARRPPPTPNAATLQSKARCASLHLSWTAQKRASTTVRVG